MNEPLVIGIRSVELGVTDLDRSLRFYTQAWGLDVVSKRGRSSYLRGRSGEHHILQLTEARAAGLIGVDFAVATGSAVERVGELAGLDHREVNGPYEPAAEEGGGWKIDIMGIEALRVGISANVTSHPQIDDDLSRPYKLTHVVVNTRAFQEQREFFLNLLGFRLSDSTQRMDFLRSGTDHHSLALAPGDSMSLNHAAFEMHDIDSQMYGSGRVIAKGFPLEWGVGRHGPGSNVFCYFIDPDGLAVEYTTEVDQVDDKTHVARTPDYWTAFPNRPCRWGVATKPSTRLAEAFAGHGLARTS